MNCEKKGRGGIPAWMVQGGEQPYAGPVAHTGFLAKTLRLFSQVLENEFYCERYAARPGLLQGVDARVKLLVLLGYLIFSAFAASIPVLLALAAAALLYAGLSGLELRSFARRAWAYLPPLVFVLSLPGASGLFTKGTPLFYLVPPGAPGFPDGLWFSAAGLLMAVRLALRPGISLSFAFLLLLTTRWSVLMEALGGLHLPASAVSILNMAYRYLFVVAKTAGELLEARFLRTVGRLGAAENRRFLGRSAALLFVKSHYLSEEIYDAMLCRGFTGRTARREFSRPGAADILFAAENFLIILVLIVGEHLF